MDLQANQNHGNRFPNPEDIMTRDQLLASLIETVDRESVVFDDGAYIDWSTRNDNGTQRLTVQDGDGDVAILNLTIDQIVRLQQALTVFVLES